MMRRGLFFGLVLAAAGLLGAVLWRSGSPPPSSPQKLLAEAQTALQQGRYQRAEAAARTVLTDSPQSLPALITAAEAATRRGRYDAALRYYAQLPASGSADELAAGRFGQAELLRHVGRLSEAEAKFRRLLRQAPDFMLAHNRLAFLLGASGRRWESVPHLMELIRRRDFAVPHLLMLGDVERVLEERAVLDAARQTAPDDPLRLLGEARIALFRNDPATAEPLLQRVVTQSPHLSEAQARFGQILVERGAAERFLAWHAGLPAEADRHPEIWVVRGAWAARRDQPRVAVRCFWEAVRRDPNHRQANYRLGRTLQELGRPEQAAPFLKRAEQLQHLAIVLDGFFYAQNDPAAMAKAAVLTESLGRLWEAWAWAQAALNIDPNLDWARQTIARLHPRLHDDLPRTVPAANPARRMDLASYPLPEWQTPTGSDVDEHAPTTADVRFADRAAAAGIDFAYVNSDTPEKASRIFETTGGGVAALDYDGDLWPDLYFTQGGRWPVDPDQTEYVDRLYRNLGGGRAADVTERAGLGDALYSQGVAVGDFNGDGFADLYVANIGRNRLYRNNGDGTFADVTEESGVGGAQWTTSCLVADLNGDALPDLYDVNYIDDPRAFHHVCEKNGRPHSCSPRAFAAADDRLLVNRGDGRFEDVSRSAGIVQRNGYGLGVVAADFDGSGRLSLFVANDEVPNFFFANRTPAADGPPVFDEQALAAGLAADRDGRAQACMGVAAGDADGDGRLDLFVTNFYEESNTLYRQLAPGLFEDATREAGLRDPSYLMLGFGTQFLDADLDGAADLVVANGHIDDQTAAGKPYHMPPQFFRNRGDGTFAELSADQLGPYFQGKYLGRGLARLDWNRDGREDFAVSNMNAPASLVINETAAGRFLAVRLCGTMSARDALGTTVSLTADGRTQVRQLTAGDGYQASNERRLVFGLGTADRISELRIRWPTGREQVFGDLPADIEVLAVEGTARPLRIPDAAP